MLHFTLALFITATTHVVSRNIRHFSKQLYNAFPEADLKLHSHTYHIHSSTILVLHLQNLLCFNSKTNCFIHTDSYKVIYSKSFQTKFPQDCNKIRVLFNLVRRVFTKRHLLHSFKVMFTEVFSKHS